MTAPSSEDETSFSISEDLFPCNVTRQSDTTSLSFSNLLYPPLRLQTNEAECGGQLWPAGMVLAEYLLRNKINDMKGKTMFVCLDTFFPSRLPSRMREAAKLFRADVRLNCRLELGTGSGLVGLALALAVQHSPSTTTIHLTDGLPALIPLLHHNIALNFPNTAPNLKVYPAILDWAQSLPATIPKHPDVLLAADCAYLEASFPPLLKTIQELMGEKTVLWFCYKKRRRADGGMVRSLSKVFSVVEVKGGRWEKEGVFLYEVRRKNGERKQMT